MKLQAAYAGDKAKEITNREAEVVNAWLNLQALCDARKAKLADTGDLFKFFNMCRILMLWMDDVNRQMNTTEKPRWVVQSFDCHFPVQNSPCERRVRVSNCGSILNTV